MTIFYLLTPLYMSCKITKLTNILNRRVRSRQKHIILNYHVPFRSGKYILGAKHTQVPSTQVGSPNSIHDMCSRSALILHSFPVSAPKNYDQSRWYIDKFERTDFIGYFFYVFYLSIDIHFYAKRDMERVFFFYL